jgi:hypothetical protein
LTGPDYLTGNTWREQLNLISNDSLFYLVALQLIVNPSSQEYLYEPSYIMSQAAANILRVIKPPSLAADSIATFHVIDCPGSVSYDTLSFSNQGGTNLIFYFNNAYFKNGTPGFELVSPKVQTTIPPGDTIRVVLRYTYQAGQHGPAVDTLMISHNDANQPVNPWQVHCTATIDTFAVKNYSENGVDIDNFLDVGFVCIGDTKDTLIIIKNFSGFPLTIDSAYTLDKVIYTGNILSPVKMPVLDTAKIRLTFTPVIEGTFWSQLVITFKECPAYADTILLKGTGIRSRYQFIGINSGDTLDFGKVCVGDFKTLDVLIKNISAIDETIGTVTISDINNFDNTITGSSIVAPSDTATISTGFKPQTPGPFSTKLKIGLQYCGNFIDSVYLKGTGISSGLSFTSTGNFPNPVKVGDKDTLKITLTNTGTGPAYILSLPALNPPFRVIGSVPAVPVLLNPGGSVVISVEYTPLAEGNDSETLKIFSEARNGACPDSAEIRINAQAIKAHITLSKYDMDFGLIAPCKIAYDTVIVRNTGTANVSILTKGTFRGTDASLFKVIQEPPNVPYTMKPGDTSRYIIAFVPAGTTDGDKTAEFLITTDDPVDSILVVNLKGRVQGLIVSYPTTVDFGTAQAGTSVNRIYTIINNGELDAHILSITSTIPNLTIIPNSNILIPKNGGSVNITLTLHFTVAGPVSGTLKLIFDEQCNDTINSTLKGNGTAGKVQGPGNLNFGTLAPCETKTLADSIRNIGDAPFILLSMSITGTDAGLFHFTDNVTLPYQLGAGESFGRNITYDPQNSTDGQKSAILVYTVILNGDTVEVRSDLIGERASGLLSVPYEVDFGSVVIEATDTRSLTLRNISTITTRIIKVLPFSDPAFSLQPPDINVDLLPNDSIVVTVLFSPTETRDYRDTLKLAIKVGPCNDTINIIITGKGLPGGNVLLWIPDTLVEPDLNNFSLPVFGMITNNTGSLNGLSLHAILSFNATIFYVYNEGIGNGQLLSRTTSILPGNLLTMRNIEFQMNNITLTQNPSMIGVLTGSTLLGDRDTTSVTWSLADWAIGKSLIGSTTLKKGSISLKICRAGGDRLLNYISPLKMQIQPNPAFDKIEVTATLLESGVHRIELMDIKGDTRVLDAWLIQPNGNKEYSHEFVTDGIQSGIYYIRLVTPTNSITQPVFIIK